MAKTGSGAGGTTDPPHTRSDNLSIGAAGELLVRAVLESIGVYTSLAPPGIGYDIAAYAQDHWVRVQVKATSVISKDGRYEFKTHRRPNRGPLTRADCDVVALVALPLRVVLFRNVRVVRGVTFKLSPSKFRSEFEVSGWEQAIK